MMEHWQAPTGSPTESPTDEPTASPTTEPTAVGDSITEHHAIIGLDRSHGPAVAHRLPDGRAHGIADTLPHRGTAVPSPFWQALHLPEASHRSVVLAVPHGLPYRRAHRYADASPHRGEITFSLKTAAGLHPTGRPLWQSPTASPTASPTEEPTAAPTTVITVH
jgi:hypothetical protein